MEVKSPCLSLLSEQTVHLTLANWEEVTLATFVTIGGKQPTHEDWHEATQHFLTVRD